MKEEDLGDRKMRFINQLQKKERKKERKKGRKNGRKIMEIDHIKALRSVGDLKCSMEEKEKATKRSFV
jgi:hypothetical protein